MLEAREEADAARGNLPALRSLRAKAEAQAGQIEAELRLAFAQGQLEGAKARTAQLAYLVKLARDLGEATHEAEAALHAAQADAARLGQSEASGEGGAGGAREESR